MEVVNVSVNEAFNLLSEKGVHLLDVRTPAEHADGHPPVRDEPSLIPWMLDSEGGRVSNPSFVEDFVAAFPGKETPMLLLCRSGVRSTAAIKALQTQLGYTKLLNVDGGWLKWIEEGLPTMK